jgi:AsmA protein
VRKSFIAIGITLLTGIVFVALFLATFDVQQYRGTIQSELQKRIGRPVTLGAMHLKLWPPSFGVQDLAIADDPRFSPDAPFVKAKELDVSIKLLPLLHRRIEIDSLDLERSNVNLIKNQAGEWNFASIGHPPKIGTTVNGQQTPRTSKSSLKSRPEQLQTSAQPNTAPGSSTETMGQQVSLGKLTIQDGQISVLDQTHSQRPSVYDHINITLKNFSMDSHFTLDAMVHIPGAGAQELTLEGEGGPIAEQDLSKTPFHGRLKLKQVRISDFTNFLNSPVLNGTDGVMTGKTAINSLSGQLTAAGETNIEHVKVGGMELGFPIAVEYDLRNDTSIEVITVRKLVIKLGPTPLEINGIVRTRSTPANIDVNLLANNVSIAEAARVAAASGMALSQRTSVTGTININIRVTGAADKPALMGNVTAKNVQMTGNAIPQPIQIPSVIFNLSPSEIRSSPFNVVSGGTDVSTQLTMRNYLSSSPIVDATVKAPNAQLSAILAMAKAYGVTSLDKVNGDGTLNLDMRASGPVKSISAAEIEKGLNGTINLNFANVKYSGANISKEFAEIAGFLNAGSAAQDASGVTNMQRLTGNIAVKNGVAQTSDLQAKLDVGNIGLVGTASLISEALNMRATVVISQPISQKVGGQRVSGFMKTALANNQGELVIPAVVTGTFSKPKFEPDIQQLAQMKLKGLIPNINNPASVASTLQNLLPGPKDQPADAPQQDAQPNPVQQILGLLSKKKAGQ